jgi:nuclear pore complex protein Nup205
LQPELERALQRNRSKFIDILKNPVRSTVDADLVKKASTEGIRLEEIKDYLGNKHPLKSLIYSLQSGETSIMQRLPNQIVEEAFILSDMFQMNEITALHLLLQGKHTQQRYLMGR